MKKENALRKSWVSHQSRNLRYSKICYGALAAMYQKQTPYLMRGKALWKGYTPGNHHRVNAVVTLPEMRKAESKKWWKKRTMIRKYDKLIDKIRRYKYTVNKKHRQG